MVKKKKNPLPEQDKVANRIEPDIETDNFSEEEQRKIVEMVRQDVVADQEVMDRWLEERKLDLMHYDGAKPSLLENLTKKTWHSDRNMGLCGAIVDTYQSTLSSTCWNPDTIHFIATEKNDIENKDNLERFTKWAVGKNEGDVGPEVFDFILNKITQGFSAFKIYWKIWYEWVDHRMPKEDGGYTIKTSYDRFEKGVMENVDHLEDLLMPRYGRSIQDLPHVINVLHLYGHEIIDFGERDIFMNVTEGWMEKARINSLSIKKQDQVTEQEKAEELDLKDVTDDDLRSLPVDLHAWYGIYTRKGKTEKYRFVVELTTDTMLSGKSLRKITRSGKYPFVGGPFIRKPGFVKGKSLPRDIVHIVNAFNNIYNQKSDFQFITNCPFGFFKPDENFQNQKYDIEPGVLYPTDDPAQVNIPNLARSMAWADGDMRVLFELLEKKTGAASYFQTTERNSSGTATRDKLVAQQSQTRFGIWVTAIQDELSEALTMFINMYQDTAPPLLGQRILGEDGKELIRNFSIKTLRGNYDARIEPDITAGSKVYEKEIQLWAFENLQKTIWLDPRMNPKGSWKLTADTLKKMGHPGAEIYMPPEPPATPGSSQLVKDEWMRFMQGEKFPPNPTDNIQEHVQGHMKQKTEKYNELDEEYRMNFDAHLFATMIQYQKMIKDMQAEKMADQIASNMIQRKESGIQGAEQEVDQLRGQPGGGTNGMDAAAAVGPTQQPVPNPGAPSGIPQ